jgi:hypothetical protein
MGRAGIAVVVVLVGLAAGCSGDDDDDAADATTTAAVATTTTAVGAASTDAATTTSGGETTTTTGAATTTASVDLSTPTTIVASGVPATRDFPLVDFTGADVSVFTATITRGDAFAVSVTADDNVFDRLVVEVREGVLHLGIADNTTLQGATLSATVTMPEVSSVDGSGGAILTVGGFQTDVDRDLELSGASQLTGELRAAGLSLDVSGGGIATLSGGAASLEVDGSGGAIVSALDLPVTDADVELSGGSQAELTVTAEISADLSGGSELRYAGGATQGDVETSGGSSIFTI